jgi:hypothetical protein
MTMPEVNKSAVEGAAHVKIRDPTPQNSGLGRFVVKAARILPAQVTIVQNSYASPKDQYGKKRLLKWLSGVSFGDF